MEQDQWVKKEYVASQKSLALEERLRRSRLNVLCGLLRDDPWAHQLSGDQLDQYERLAAARQFSAVKLPTWRLLPTGDYIAVSQGLAIRIAMSGLREPTLEQINKLTNHE